MRAQKGGGAYDCISGRHRKPRALPHPALHARTQACAQTEGGVLLPSLQVAAVDADSGSLGAVSYSLGTGISSFAPSAFRLGEETGLLCTAGVLDRDEGIAAYDFTVTAVDGVSRPSQWRSSRGGPC